MIKEGNLKDDFSYSHARIIDILAHPDNNNMEGTSTDTSGDTWTRNIAHFMVGYHVEDQLK